MNQKNNFLNTSDIIQERQPLNETYAKYTDKSSQQKRMKELKDENDLLQKRIASLESQVKHPQANEDLKKALQESNQQRDQLHQDISTKSEEMKKESEKYQKLIDELREAKQEADSSNNQLQERINNLLSQIEELKLQIAQKNAKI